MAGRRKDKKEKSYGLGLVVSTVLVLLIHFFLLSKVELHPTIHVALGFLGLFIVIVVMTELLPQVSA